MTAKFAHRAACLLLFPITSSFGQTPTSTATWLPDGGAIDAPLVVSSLLVNATAGPKLWIGGNFTSVGKRTGRAAWVDASTGAADLSFPVISAASVQTFAQYGTKGWLVAGESLAADSVGFPYGFAELINTDGSVNPGFQVQVDSM